MDTSKIIKGVVNSGRYTVTAPIVKEDYGLYLKIEGVELPSTYEVDFSNSESNGTSVTMIGNADGVLIPSQFISSGKDVFAFLYHVGEDYGRTVYKFRIPNKVRPDRTEETPTPEEQSTIDQLISALNSAVEQTGEDVESASQSAQSAESAKTAAESARDTAGEYANDAESSAASASTSASQASTSATASAQSASQSAQIKADVEDMVDDAQGYAQASAQSASASAQSASDAQGYAQSASSSAQSASGYASNAQTSANTASNKASEASTSAQTASQKATEASQSASQALSYKTDAESAKTASQTAQGLAESARDTAVQAKNDAESARDTAQTLVDGITGKVEQIDSNTERIESLEDDRYKPYVVDSASGSIASFPDGADDLPLKSLVVDINPVQDLHGQDAPYPAGGGKNILPYASQDTDSKNGITWTKNSDGSITFSGTCSASAAMTFVEFKLPAGDYLFSNVGSTFASTGGNLPAVYIRDLDNALTLASIGFGRSVNGISFSLSVETNIRFYAVFQTDNVVSGVLYPMIRLASVTDATYAPYENICPISGWTEVDVNHSDADMTNPTTITINLGQTVYGGKLDVLSGELVVDRAMVDLGTLEWTYSGNIFFSTSTPFFGNGGSALVGSAKNVCEIYENAPVTLSNPINGRFNVSNTQNLPVLRVSDNRFTDTSSLKTALDGVKAVFELATPITVQLSANQLNSLYGVNNIWADSGDTSAEYRADTKLFIERLTAPDSADMIADANIQSGKYFMVGNSLYKATANIANGAQIVVGTNCIRKSLSEALNEINA